MAKGVKLPKAVKKVLARSGESFTISEKRSSIVKSFGEVSYQINGGRRYLRNDQGRYLSRVIAESLFGDIQGKRVMFKDGNSLNLEDENLTIG